MNKNTIDRDIELLKLMKPYIKFVAGKVSKITGYTERYIKLIIANKVNVPEDTKQLVVESTRLLLIQIFESNIKELKQFASEYQKKNN